jgi:hypothetical protein
VSVKQPHGPVTANTIARWIKNILNWSGIDTETFSAHLTRSVVASQAVSPFYPSLSICVCCFLIFFIESSRIETLRILTSETGATVQNYSWLEFSEKERSIAALLKILCLLFT